jgi:UDP-N-acetylmuramate: L-alanyl-gamma-D-glutamyl-meso-diaminopimelate ligase
MKVHFIAVGGAVMHNLAIALHKKGYQVSGSDDEIFEPSRSRLASYGILPATTGWDPGRITSETDVVILGMHARADNPELLKAGKLGVRIMSFPEYLYEQTRNKKRIVVAGSHGKTTTTAMIMHVFRDCGLNFDYMVGSSVDGFETMVGLSDDSEIAVFEGDEYLTSTLDRRPKFLHYKPDIAIINGIAWDHMNVFPTFEEYKEQFRIFAECITKGGHLLYFSDDPELKAIAESTGNDINKTAYGVHGYFRNKEGFFCATHERVVQLKIFGGHNMQNLSAAKEACLLAGLSENQFYNSVKSFTGTSGRLQKIHETEKGSFFLDFAHAPSKVKATLESVAESFSGRELIACLELHTYSSLNSAFLPLYRNTLDKADKAFIYFNPHAVEMKKLKAISVDEISTAFGGNNLMVFNDITLMCEEIRKLRVRHPVYLFMSSGNFNGTNLEILAKEIL